MISENEERGEKEDICINDNILVIILRRFLSM
jgi:hypothetical protein